MIKLIAIGKIKDKHLQALCDEYTKRIGKYQKMQVIEVNDEAIPNNLNEKLRTNILDVEAERVLSKVKDNEYLVLLDLHGKQLDSIEFSEKIKAIQTYHTSNITFVIGGSLGVGEALLKRSDYRLCLSKMTFLHQMTRLIVLEQIYRAFKIANNENYNK